MNKVQIESLLSGDVQTILTENLPVSLIVEAFSEFNSPSFVSALYESKHDISFRTVSVGFSTLNMYKSDLKTLKELLTVEINPITLVAIQEQIDSIEESLEKGIGNNSKYTCKDVMATIEGGKNSTLSMHKEHGTLYFSALSINKTILVVKEPYKERNSKPKTIEKNRIKKMLKSSNYRKFILHPERIHSTTFKGNSITFNYPQVEELKAKVVELGRPLTWEEYQEMCIA
jgi:hypothetical protein